MIITKIKYYRFDISKKEELKKYNAMCKMLKEKGLTKDTTHYINFSYESNKDFLNKIKAIERKGFCEIETEFIFSNQMNTSEESFNLRVYDWDERIYLNEDIKEGYFLQDVKELFKLRNNTSCCGYCGKQYTREQKEGLSFCDSCLSSEFLKEEELFLLRLKRIDDKTERLSLNDCDKEALLNVYHSEQKRGRTKRLNKRIEEKKKDLRQELKNAKSEYKGFMWLINNNLDYDNVIYYDHLKEFCFGWRNNLSFEEEQKLKKSLKDFPFKYELKV